jgi:hypothetical protein
MTYDPNKAFITIASKQIEGFEEETSIVAEHKALSISLDIKDIGKVEGVVYLTQEQFEVYCNKYGNNVEV